MTAKRGKGHHLFKHGEFAGERGMQHRAYMQDWREPPERFLRRMREWRKRTQKWLRSRGLAGASTVVLWEGPSRLVWPATRIAVVAARIQLGSKPNPKTGPMVQIHIVPLAESPMDAVRAGRDAPVCGECPHRPSLGGRCYVSTQFGPTQVWKSVVGGRRRASGIAPPAPRLSLLEARRLLRGAVVRIGAWGDPAAAPLHVWEHVVGAAESVTAYTHQWRDLSRAWSAWCMASVDSEAELEDAREAGWRTFRVLWDGDEPRADERQCPAQAHKVPCFSCRGCGGHLDGRRISFYVTPHGGRLGRGQAKSVVPRPGSKEARRLGPRASDKRKRRPRSVGGWSGPVRRPGRRHRGREGRPLCGDWRPHSDVVDNGRPDCPACEEADTTGRR